MRSLAARTDSSTALMKSPESSKRSRSARGYDGADDVSSPRSGILETPISSIAAFDKDGSEAMRSEIDLSNLKPILNYDILTAETKMKLQLNNHLVLWRLLQKERRPCCCLVARLLPKVGYLILILGPP